MIGINRKLNFSRGYGASNAQTGFSLIEVLISFLLVGVGVLGLIKLQVYVEQKADFAEKSIEALYLAEKKLEEFTRRGASSATINYSFNDIQSDTCVSTTICNSVTSVPKLMCSMTLQSGLANTAILIEIEACWADRFGDTETLILKTMLSKYSEFD